jgi:dolichol kinase
MTPEPAREPDPFEPLRSKRWISEAQRKAIHLGFLILPLGLLHEWLPWPRGHAQWRMLLIGLVVASIGFELARLHEDRFRRWFREFFGELIRDHEQFNLLGSTYLLIAALLAVEIFPQPVAAAALGYTVLGDALAALAGRAYGRTRFFNKSLEGYAAGLVGCLLWAGYVTLFGGLRWEIALVGALVASLVELLPIPLDDNLGMTLFAGYSMKLLGGGS